MGGKNRLVVTIRFLKNLDAMRKYDVVVLGGINSDFIVRGRALPTPGQTIKGEYFYAGAGGKGANQAVAAARLGAHVALIGAVGDDDRGRDLLKQLKKDGVDVRQVVFKKNCQTGAAVIAVDQDGEKQIAAAPGANCRLTIADVKRAAAVIRSSKVLLMQFESPMPCLIAAARLARKANARVVLDPAPARALPAELAKHLDVIRPNASEAEVLTGVRVVNSQTPRKAARKLRARGIQLVSLEAGSEGDLLVSEDEEHLFPRLKVRAVDATGAGDAFAAALAVGLAENLSLLEMGRLANATAALATTKVGAQEGLPTRREAENLMKRRDRGDR